MRLVNMLCGGVRSLKRIQAMGCMVNAPTIGVGQGVLPFGRQVLRLMEPKFRLRIAPDDYGIDAGLINQARTTYFG